MANTTKKKRLTAKELDASDDVNELADQFDSDSGTKRFNVDMPIWALRELDREATRRGVPRQSLVKSWLIDRLDEIRREQKQSVPSRGVK